MGEGRFSYHFKGVKMGERFPEFRKGQSRRKKQKAGKKGKKPELLHCVESMSQGGVSPAWTTEGEMSKKDYRLYKKNGKTREKGTVSHAES